MRTLTRLLRRILEECRSIARALVEMLSDYLAGLERSARVMRTRNSPLHAQAYHALLLWLPTAVPPERHDEAVAAFDLLIDQGIDPSTALAVIMHDRVW